MPESSFSLPSFAKINLGLRVIGKRPDGFHEICTVFQTVTLSDTISFDPAQKIDLTCSDASIPCDHRNLILRAAQRLRAHAFQRGMPFGGEVIGDPGRLPGAKMHLEKRIPSPGGLGGGSSNAAVALIGLSRLWNLRIGLSELALIGGDLGSDVPFFLAGGTAFGSGRGTDITSIVDFHAENLLIVTPRIDVSTAEAFDSLNAPCLTTDEANRILGVCRSEAESAVLDCGTLGNDFENTVFAAHPEIGQVKQRLLDLGASAASLSGSGASVFGIFEKKETRRAAQKALDDEVNWRKFAVATISRNEYREALEIAF